MAGTPDPAAGSIAQRYVLVNDPDGAVPGGSERAASRSSRTRGSPPRPSSTWRPTRRWPGAVGCILISDTTNPTAVKGLIPCAIVSPTDGEVLVDAISSTDDNAIDPANGAVSELPIRLNPYLDDTFYGTTTAFSSRGPVEGLGQIKPDVRRPASTS